MTPAEGGNMKRSSSLLPILLYFALLIIGLGLFLDGK